MFDKVKEDLHPDNPKYNVSTSFRDEAHDLIALHNDYMDGTVSRGLEVFMRMMVIEDHDKLLAKMDWCLTHDVNLDYSLRKSISAVAQDDRRTLTDNAHNARDNAELQPMEFLGDNHVDGPPFAWVLLWNGKYSNAIGDYVPKLLRQLGYVFWDKERIIHMEAEALIARQWESHPGLVEEIFYDRGWAPAERLPQESATNTLEGWDN
ncbi:hypothetical protein CkaCkLH20_07820 [Colletotrichum karsti]|uniref:Uncharacterized protein n=1 Tax=Colletotrichum karsti TaxID=1095194 RepID=A0A9P6I1E7_9PEZI|nr:uncharacterized protein CkaCkLH20_07820 [Colletotrichum karsti]KAF9874683.1 hypothetical protein CkaCkLH20_07820 [Colletotrichum karsti]